METRHVCIIGAGHHSKANLYPSLLCMDGVVIDAVCTRHIDTAKEAASRCGPETRAYDNVEEMLEHETCRKVVICVRAQDAPALTKVCLAKGWTVFCEKPLGLSVREAVEIDSASKTSGSSYMVAFMKKYAPVYLEIKKAVDSRSYGNALSYRGAFNVDASRFCKTDSDFMYLVAIHYLSLVRFLFGKADKITVIRNKEGSGNSYHLLLQHPGNVIGSLQFENRSAWTKEFESLEVTFEDAYICTENLGKCSLHESNETSGTLSEKEIVLRTSEAPGSGAKRDLILRGFIGELDDFLSRDVFDPDENREIHEMIEEILGGLE